MDNNMTSPKRRRPGRKAEDIRLAWREQAPDALFAGKTIADLEAVLATVNASTEDLRIKDQARSAALKKRGEQLKSLASLLRTVVRGVQGHPAYGEDSPLYRAMGFVPFSERRSGLTRRSNSAAGGQEETAA